MTNLVYRDGRDLGRGGFPFIHYRQTCTDGIGEALRKVRGGGAEAKPKFQGGDDQKAEVARWPTGSAEWPAAGGQ